ncbi:MAG: hypothetical protein WCK96_19575 [Methylococcales bacterium]
MYQNNSDKFARLRTIESGQTTTAQNLGNNNQARNWSYEKDGNVMGTITGFDSFEHPQFGEQHTVIVRLADTNELVSAFLNDYLQEGMRRQNAQVGDLILIQFLGKQPSERFNRFHLEIEKSF